MGSVQDALSQKRLTETFAGRAAALLLLLIWLAAMSMTDVNAYSFLPTLGGLAVVVLLALSALLRGAKMVRLTGLAWVSLGIGVYYLVRCLCSFDVVGAWREAPLILGCGVFYLSGVCAAQGRSMRPALLALAAALLLNMLFYWLMHDTALPVEWTGRPEAGPGGVNTRPVSLFVYKNQASAFFALSGMLLLAAALWHNMRSVSRLALAALGLGSVLLSGCCGSRAGYLIVPLMACAIMVLWVVLRLYTQEKYGAGIFVGAFLVLLGMGLGIAQLFFEPGGLNFLASTDSHQRFGLWAQCCTLLPDAPLTGYGASSVPWLLAPFLELYSNWSLANYAHNEYLQVWLDYGIIGLLGMVFIVGGHILNGFGALISEPVSPLRRCMTALAMLCLLSWFVASSVDYFWHQFSITAMTAFAAGVLASPYVREDRRRGTLVRVTLLGARGKAVLALLGTAVLCVCAWLIVLQYPAWSAQWRFNELSRGGADADGEARLALITELIPGYPSSRLMDTAYTLPGSGKPWTQEEACLRAVLRANPRQLFMAVQLGRMLTEQGRYAEAESVFRRYYIGDGMASRRTTHWPNFYVYNLFNWGHALLLSGDASGAYSRLAYALRVTDSLHINFAERVLYRHDAWYADEEMRRRWADYLAARRQDVALLEMLGTAPDDTWMQPLEEGGKPALYRRFGCADAAEREKVASPFAEPVKKAQKKP